VEPTNIRFGGGVADTVLHPAVAIALCITILLVWSLPRKYVIIPWILNVFLVPLGQVLVVGGIHFTVYRLVVLAGLVRVVTMKRSPGTPRLAGGFTGIDGAFSLFAVLTFVTFALQWMEAQALIRGLGTLLDALGGFYVLRCLIRDKEGVKRAVTVLAVVAIILGACMVAEQITDVNMFWALGAGPAEAAVRGGKVRSTGSFEVYITAGVFGATLVPLLVWLWSGAKARLRALMGIVGATVMVITSTSSTPLLAYGAGVGGLCLWPLRRHMRGVRWCLALLVVGAELCMKAPVWALIARVDLTGSSSGYHRYMLVDQCVRHFAEWWLIGTKHYNEWGYDMWDLSNQYVACAVTGGLATLVAFLGIISRSFGQLGRARKRAGNDRKRDWYLWCIGAALLSHVVAYFGVAYFDQMQAAWYALLAIICAAAPVASRAAASRGKKALATGDQSESGEASMVPAAGA